VGQPYWGVRAGQWLLLQGYFTDDEVGQSRLFDVNREHGFLIGFMPVFGWYPCCLTKPLDRAEVATIRIV
jgi:hypothetical protein